MQINPATEQKITELIATMSVRDKILQMFQMDKSAHKEDFPALSEENLGSYLSIMGEEVETLREKAKATPHAIPPIFGIDAIHGHAFRPYATIFPSQLAAACSWNEELIEEMGAATAKEVNADGLDWVFSPVLCIARDTRWGRVDETFGEDPYLIGKLGAAMIRGYERDNLVASCAKHYIGYGESTGGRDSYDSEVTMRKVREVFLPPFKEAVDAGTYKVMTAYGTLDGTQMTAYKELLTDILRGELGFEGFVVTDYLNFKLISTKHRVAENAREAARFGVSAGNDMSMNTAAFIDAAVAEVECGNIPMEQIDLAVRRILRVKFALGLFDEKERMPKSVIGCREHRRLNHLLTRQSLVLLKNSGILPIDGTPEKAPKKIAVIGPNANNMENQYGDWTFTSHRDPSEYKRIKNDCYTMLAGMREIFSESEIAYCLGCPIQGEEGADIEKAVRLAEGADLVVLALGDELAQNGEAKDRSRLELTGKQNELLAAVKATGKPVITVMITGKPLCIDEVLGKSDAVVQMFCGSDLGGLAAAELIAGKFNPCGKLPISYPRSAGALPCYYNGYTSWHWGKYCDEEKGALLSFGHGLSYTEYEYSDMEVSARTVKNGENFEVSANITNKGGMAGEETVQLYVTDHYSSVMTPRINLRGFKKIHLEPDETKRVCFTVTPADLALVNRREETVVEPGKFTVYVAPCAPDFTYEDEALAKVIEVV
ncbi:MAG: glycoside hydrolase family 3 C-terminal domain-containing protein [Clostridia bacterium]|nr:glycoside hydrolase family 3 C-terminal domain-containing protein [Clostridia bacterium]